MRARAGIAVGRTARIGAVCVLTAVLTGCAGAGDAALPDKAELTAWADGAISENQTGGAAYIVREQGTLGATDQLRFDLAGLAGPGSLALACLTSESGLLEVLIEGEQRTTRVEMECSTSADTTEASAFDVLPTDTVTLTADDTVAFVYSVTPGAQPQD